MTETPQITLKQVLGDKDYEDFDEFDITEAQQVLRKLSIDRPMDLGDYEKLQQQSLYAADLLIGFIAKLNKTVYLLETKINSRKNAISLNYKASDGKTTAEMRKSAGECDEETGKLNEQIGKAKGAKLYLDKKYELLIKSHHHFKDLASSIRNTGNTNMKNTYKDDETNNTW